jgi:phage-related protein
LQSAVKGVEEVRVGDGRLQRLPSGLESDQFDLLPGRGGCQS